MREDRMNYNESPKISIAQTNFQSVIMILLSGCLSKVHGQDTNHNSLRYIFKKKSPASELRLPLVSVAPETDSNIRLDSINKNKMEVNSWYLRKEFL